MLQCNSVTNQIINRFVNIWDFCICSLQTYKYNVDTFPEKMTILPDAFLTLNENENVEYLFSIHFGSSNKYTAFLFCSVIHIYAYFLKSTIYFSYKKVSHFTGTFLAIYMEVSIQIEKSRKKLFSSAKLVLLFVQVFFGVQLSGILVKISFTTVFV